LSETNEIKLKLKQFCNCFETVLFQPKENAPPMERLAVSANYRQYPLFARKTGGAGK